MIDGSELWAGEVSVGEVTHPPGARLGPRWQRNVQLVFVQAGSVRVTVDGRALPVLRAGSVCLLLPGHHEAFAFASDPPTRHVWLQGRVEELPPELEQRLGRLPFALPTSAALATLARSALDATTMPGAEPLLRALLAAALWRFMSEGERQLTTTPPLVEHAREQLHAHLHDPALDVAALARACNVSGAHLARVFRHELGIGPIAYLWERRVAAGVDLLANSGLPVGTVAARCGFKTVYHFSRRVKLATGLPPTELRRRRWEAAGAAERVGVVAQRR